MLEIQNFNAYKKDGKFSIPLKDKMQEYINKLPEGSYVVRIERKKKKRSNEQNAYYWIVMEFVGQSLGYTKDEMHNTFKAMFLTDKSSCFPVVKSTSKLQTVEFCEYLENIIRVCAENDIIVPPAETPLIKDSSLLKLK